MSNSNLIPLHPEEPNTFVQDSSAAHEAASQSNNIRSHAAVTRAAGMILTEALKNDTDPIALQADTSVGGLMMLNPDGDGANYAYRLKQKAIKAARDKFNLAVLTGAEDERSEKVFAAQLLANERRDLGREAATIEQAVLDKYDKKNDEALRDPKLLADPNGREQVARQLLKKLQ